MSTFNFNSRHLAASEVVSDILHSYGAEILLHIAVIKSDVKLTKEDFRKALVLLTDFQPALRMHIVTENKGKEGITKRFVESKTVQHDVTVTKGNSDKAWLKLAEKELQSGFNTEEGPLWKVTFVDLSESAETGTEEIETFPNGNVSNGTVNGNSSDYGYVTFQKKKEGKVRFKEDYEGVLLFKIHHAIADGISMFNMVQRQLINLLHKVIKKEDLSDFQTPISMMPGIDESFIPKESTLKKNGLHRRGSSKKSRRRSSASSSEALFTPLLYDAVEFEPTGPSETRILPVTIGRSATNEIMLKCGLHNVPVHSALVTAASLAFAYLTTSQGFKLPPDVICGLPMDLREYSTIAGYQSLGRWLGYGTMSVKTKKDWIGPDQFWTEVTKVNEKLSSEKPWKNFDVHQEALRNFIRSEGDISFAADLSRTHLEVFDIGNCDFDAKDKTGTGVGLKDRPESIQVVRMEEHFFAQSMSDVTMSPFCVTTCIYHNKLMFTVVFNNKWIEKSFATTFVDAFLSLLHHVIPITPEKIEYKKQTNHGPATHRHQNTRGVQQRLAWKEMEKIKKERKLQRKGAGNLKSRSQSLPRLTKPVNIRDEEVPKRRQSAAPIASPNKANNPKGEKLLTMPPLMRARAIQPRMQKIAVDDQHWMT